MIHIHTVTAIETTPRDPDTMYGTCVDCFEAVYSFFIESDDDRLGTWSQWREIYGDL